MYCYFEGVQGRLCSDKVVREGMNYIDIAFMVRGNGWFSITDKSFDGDMKFFLKNLYGERSSYENGVVAGTGEKRDPVDSVQHDNGELDIFDDDE